MNRRIIRIRLISKKYAEIHLFFYILHRNSAIQMIKRAKFDIIGTGDKICDKRNIMRRI